jgi:hypothetical protein
VTPDSPAPIVPEGASWPVHNLRLFVGRKGYWPASAQMLRLKLIEVDDEDQPVGPVFNHDTITYPDDQYLREQIKSAALGLFSDWLDRVLDEPIPTMNLACVAVVSDDQD